MKPDEIIREGRRLLEPYTGKCGVYVPPDHILRAALDALEEALTKGVGCAVIAGQERRRAERAEAALAAYEQTSGDLCPVCGWRGIRGNDGCAFCTHEHTQGRADPEWVVGRRMLAAAQDSLDKAEAALAETTKWYEWEKVSKARVQIALRKAEAALAKVTEERDEARRACCINLSELSTHDPEGRERTPREECLRAWPDAADRLFPGGGK